MSNSLRQFFQFIDFPLPLSRLHCRTHCEKAEKEDDRANEKKHRKERETLIYEHWFRWHNLVDYVTGEWERRRKTQQKYSLQRSLPKTYNAGDSGRANFIMSGWLDCTTTLSRSPNPLRQISRLGASRRYTTCAECVYVFGARAVESLWKVGSKREDLRNWKIFELGQFFKYSGEKEGKRPEWTQTRMLRFILCELRG